MTASEQREVHELVERYAQAADRADSAAVAELFAEDGVLATWLDPSEASGGREHVGRKAIAGALDALKHYGATHHTISSHTSVVEGLHATGETLCTAHHVEGTGNERRDKVLYIRYVDTFVRTSGPWLFSRREVHVQWSSTLPVDTAP